MRIDQFCSHDVVTIDAGASAHDAAALMRDRQVGALAVTRRQRHAEGLAGVAGIVTDHDLAVKVLAGGPEALETPVHDLISSGAVAVPASAGVDEVADVMRRQGVRCVLVTGPKGRLIGMAGLEEVAEALNADLAEMARAQRAPLAHDQAIDVDAGAFGNVDAIAGLPAQALGRRWRQITSP